MAGFRANFTPLEKKAFGQTLRRLMAERGLTGADLARQATLHLPRGKVIGRDNISWYCNGRSFPIPAYMVAIAKVLGVDQAFLMPRAHSQAPGEPPAPVTENSRVVQMSSRADGTMDLMLKVNVPKAIGWQIMQLVENDGQSQLPSSRKG